MNIEVVSLIVDLADVVLLLLMGYVLLRIMREAHETIEAIDAMVTYVEGVQRKMRHAIKNLAAALNMQAVVESLDSIEEPPDGE